MGNLKTISAMTLAGLLATGCATHQMTKLDAAEALSASSSAANSLHAGRAGLSSSAEGDNWTAANLFEQASAGYESPANRFNLAASYQNTGREAEAAALYRSVAADGKYSYGITTTPIADRGAPISKVNLADESNRRLAAMRAPAAVQVATNGFDASALGSDASATVGAQIQGRVSDARALQLDESIEAAGGN